MTNTLEIGMPLPRIHFNATNGVYSSFEAYKGQWLILFFCPKDATPGCTIESCDFRDREKDFSLLNAAILGVSRDSIASHEKFKEKQGLPFELISDNDEVLCSLFDVMKMKSMYGKTVRGIERSTFLITPIGTLQRAWRKVNITGHVEEVLDELKRLQR